MISARLSWIRTATVNNGIFKQKQSPIAVMVGQTRFYKYDHWYMQDYEIHRRIMEKKKKLLRELTFDDCWKFIKSNIQQLRKEFSITVPKLPDHGEFEYLFKFKTDDDLAKWKVNTDQGFSVGKSKAKLCLTDRKTAHFSGYLSQQFDRPELTKALYTGYANMQSLAQFKSFRRLKNFNFIGFTHFLLKIRGDGRTYVLVLNTPDYYKETQTFIHTTPLYTRGGPHWQYAKIPFSKFFHNSQGRIADKQYRFSSTGVKSIGITLMDHVEGPFSLEIDSISLLRDDVAYEQFAYETYKVEKLIANT
jgi:hypothetical protein